MVTANSNMSVGRPSNIYKNDRTFPEITMTCEVERELHQDKEEEHVDDLYRQH